MVDAGSIRRALAIGAALGALGVAGTALLAFQLDAPAPRDDHALVAPEGARTPAGGGEFPDSPQELREALAGRTRLALDRRALLALAELHRLQDAAPVATHARFDDGRWHVSAGGVSAGAVPELPDFEDLLALVEGAARALSPLHPLAAGGVAGPDADAWPLLSPSRPGLAALADVDAAWAAGARSPETLSVAARALVSLAVELPDTAEAGDLVTARALAVLGWARSLGRRDLEAEALLARHMGYDLAARRLAETLPEASPARAWVRRDDDALRAAAEREGAEETARYLWFRRLVERGEDAGAWAEGPLRAASAAASVVAWLPRAHAEDDDVGRAAARALPARALQALERESAADAPAARSPSDLLPRLAGLSARRAVHGPFLDRELAAARDRAVVLSALHDALAVDLAPDGEANAAAQLADLLGATTPEPFRDFVLWAAHVAHVRVGTLSPDVLLQDLAAPFALGASPFLHTYDLALRSGEPDGARRRAALERLAARLDTRPLHRARLARLGGDALRDLVLVEGLCRSLLRASRDVDRAATAWCLARAGDGESVVALARDDAAAPPARRAALELAGGLAPDDVVEPAWRALAGAPDASWPTRRAYVRWLAARGRTDEALALTAPPRRGEAPPAARVERAAVLRARGDLAEALRAVERDDGPDAARERALALAALGRFADAARVATDRLARRGDADSVALAAEVLWRASDFDGAARVLAQSGVRLGGDDWRGPIAEAFARVFEAAPAEVGERAFEALVNAALSPSRLRELPPLLAAHRRADLAARALARVDAARPLGPDAALESLVQQYLCWRALAGDAAALRWVEPRVTLESRPLLAAHAFSQRADDLLWSVAEPGRDPARAAKVWLLRAAAVLRAGERAARRDEVLRALRAAPPSDEVTLGRYLLGAGDLASAVSVARAPRRRAEVAYYLGLRAQSERRIGEASDWYQLAAMAGVAAEPEAAWAARSLDAWYGRREPLAALAASPWERSVAPPPREAPAATALAPPDDVAPGAPDEPRRGHHHRRDHERAGDADGRARDGNRGRHGRPRRR
ncbi:MAG: hypothetical protein U0324_46690 [Polyangiales bacterium]